MAFIDIFSGFGLLFYLLLVFRQAPDPEREPLMFDDLLGSGHCGPCNRTYPFRTRVQGYKSVMPFKMWLVYLSCQVSIVFVAAQALARASEHRRSARRLSDACVSGPKLGLI